MAQKNVSHVTLAEKKMMSKAGQKVHAKETHKVSLAQQAKGKKVCRMVYPKIANK